MRDRLPDEDRILFYSMYVNRFGLSDEEVKRMEQLMELLYGFPPRTWEPYCTRRTLLCNGCDSTLSGIRDLCRNSECALYIIRNVVCFGKNLKRTKELLFVISVIPQLSDILPGKIRGIIELHRSIHEEGGGLGTNEENRSHLRYFGGFYEGFESIVEFQASEMNVLLTERFFEWFRSSTIIHSQRLAALSED
ncbi:hypothetical protein Aduo_018339 [Ancylostoma duodenale]